MKLGLIGRIDRRGIGFQTGVFWQQMRKPRTLIVEMSDGWPQDIDRFGYDDVLWVRSNLSTDVRARSLDEGVCREFLDGLDVVFAVETVYEWEFCNWAREMGVRTVVQANPEMYAHDNFDLPHPDMWVWPTDWRLDELPGDTVLPVPCESHPNVAARYDDEALRVLHVIGRTAIGDRNGTYEFLDALQYVTQRVHVTIITQDTAIPYEPRRKANVTLDVVKNGVVDRWSMYENQHVVVIPRKYGGLCLPVIEGLACGLTSIMTDVPPNSTWPGLRTRAWAGRNVHTPAGVVRTWGSHAEDIARAIDELAWNRESLRDELSVAADFAAANSWESLRPLYDKVLGSVL